jgi:hypothetical protein
MPIRPGLLSEIRGALGSAVTPSLTAASAASDLFEAYVFCLILEAARAEGARVTLNSPAGSNPTPFVFRTSPGFLSSDLRNYGYANIEFRGCPPLEAHVSVRVAGHSGVLHECDVSVIRADEATLCRQSTARISPRSAKVVLAIEAKFYTVPLALHLGRGFLGLVRDISSGAVFFVMNRQAPSIEKLLSHKKQRWEKDVHPGDKRAVERFRNAVQTCFVNYQSGQRS